MCFFLLLVGIGRKVIPFTKNYIEAKIEGVTIVFTSYARDIQKSKRVRRRSLIFFLCFVLFFFGFTLYHIITSYQSSWSLNHPKKNYINLILDLISFFFVGFIMMWVKVCVFSFPFYLSKKSFVVSNKNRPINIYTNF